MQCALYDQAGKYDPNSPNHRAQAQALGMPWSHQGPTDGRLYFGNQKRRPSGRFANAGGFKKRCEKVYRASGWMPKFNIKNPTGLLYSLHACI